MSNNKISLRNITGIQELEDSTAQNYLGGRFLVERYRNSGFTMDDYADSQITVSLNNPTDPITGLGITNLGGDIDGDNIRVEYLGWNGAVVGAETIAFGRGTLLYAGNGRLTDNTFVGHARITQPQNPGNTELGEIDNILYDPCPGLRCF